MHPATGPIYRLMVVGDASSGWQTTLSGSVGGGASTTSTYAENIGVNQSHTDDNAQQNPANYWAQRQSVLSLLQPSIRAERSSQ